MLFPLHRGAVCLVAAAVAAAAVTAAVAAASVTAAPTGSTAAAAGTPATGPSANGGCFGRAAVPCGRGDTCVLGRGAFPPGPPPVGACGVRLPPPTAGVCAPLPADALDALRPCAAPGECRAALRGGTRGARATRRR